VQNICRGYNMLCSVRKEVNWKSARSLNIILLALPTFSTPVDDIKACFTLRINKLL
jgi:hypothetical protein